MHGPPLLESPSNAPRGGASHDTRRSTRGVSIAVLASLCLVSVAFFWKVVAQRDVLLPIDILYTHDPLWRALVPRSFQRTANPLDSDALTEFYPWAALAARALHQGILPLWNPYSFAGSPFLSAMQTGVLYPINLLLEWLAAPVDFIGLKAVIHLAITLTGTYVFARRLRQSVPAAVLAALAFGLSVTYIVWIEHPMSSAVAWLPWLLACIDGVIASGGSLPWALALAVTTGLEITAGHGESTAHAALLCLAYALYRLLANPGRGSVPGGRLRPALVLVAATVLGAGISAAYLLPSLAQLPLSEAAADRGSAAAVSVLGDPAQWPSLLLAAVPDIFGNPTWPVPWQPGSFTYNEAAAYAGAVTLALAVGAVLYHRRGPTLFFAVAAMVALGIAARLPVLALANDLPVLDVANNGRLRFEYAFALAVLAGYGLDALADARGRSMMLRVAWPLWLGVLILSLVGAGILLESGSNGHTAPLSAVATVALPACWLGAFVAALWLCRRGVVSAALLRPLVPALVGIELFAHGVNYHTALARSQALAVPPAVRAVSSDRSLYRVAGLGEALVPSMSDLYALQDVRGYDPAYDASYERYFAALFATNTGMRLGLATTRPPAAWLRAFDLMNVKYVFVSCGHPLPAPPFRLVFRSSGCVYANQAVMPRAVLVHQVRWATPRQAVALLADGAVDPRRVALIDPRTAHGDGWHPLAAVTGGDSVRPTYNDLNTVTVAVRSRGGGVLVMSDSYAPGWQAVVDGRAAAIARADGAFRAVAVGPGSHRVVLSYRPPLFDAGVGISLGACAAFFMSLCAAALGPLRRRRAAGAYPD